MANGSTTHGLSTIDSLVQGGRNSISRMRSLFKAIRAPLPTQTGDGTQLLIEEKQSVVRTLEEVNRDIRKMGFEGVEQLAEVFAKTATGANWDDKKYLMENMIKAVACLPDDGLSKKLTGAFLTQLWDDLSHPPQTLLGEEHLYRKPDGSGNNYILPQIGAAGMPYARTVAPKTMQDGALPDPGTLFDTVMARKDPKGLEHPSKISSMLFYLASIIIHDVFKTDHDDFNKSETSSYLDLAPLYGNNWEDQKAMRTMKNGKIHPDCFSETRLLTFPPGVGALLIMFNRYHNYVAENLARINENGRFTENPKKPTVERYGEVINKRDDDLFQTARLITCGLYVNIILIDYVRTILNLNRTDEDWQLNPRVDLPGGPPVGTGNQVAAEFNLVYRWHASVSTRDTTWTEKLFEESIRPKLGGLSVADASKPQNIRKFLGVLGQIQQEAISLKPQERPYPALKEETLTRIQDGPLQGCYQDDDLAKIVVGSIEDCANAMGPQQVPPILKVVEILGIQQARTWRVATLNEFRKHFKLEPHQQFSDITDNIEVQEALKHLYDTPDHVELYPGLVIEDAKVPMAPGSGLCPSFTTSRAVLSDAVALVRGDRYYTSSYTPAALTNWGYQEASSDLAIDNGCVFYKLISRALPNNFDQASVYAHFPLTVPQGEDGMESVLQDLGKGDKYTFERPKTKSRPQVVYSPEAAKQVMQDKSVFQPTWSKIVDALVDGKGKNFLHCADVARQAKASAIIRTPVLQTGLAYDRFDSQEKWVQTMRTFYTETTAQLLEEKSYNLAGIKEVDLVRDIGNLVHVRLAAELFGLPMKTEKFPHGVFTEHQLYIAFMAIYTSIFFDLDPPKTFTIRQQSFETVQQLGRLMRWIVSAVKTTDDLPMGVSADKLISLAIPPSSSLKGLGGLDMIKKLLQSAPEVYDVVWGKILPTCGAMLSLGEYFAAAVNFLLSPAGQEHLPAINVLAKSDTPESEKALLHYCLEAIRIGGEIPLIREATKDVTITDTTEVLGTRTLSLKPGDRVVVNPGIAQKDPNVFPDPDKFDPKRPLEAYHPFIGDGLHQFLGKPLALVALPAMLKVVARLDGLRPANVSIGPAIVPSSLKQVVVDYGPPEAKDLPEQYQFHSYLTEAWNMLLPFPTTMKVQWDPQGATKAQPGPKSNEMAKPASGWTK